jgi:hypothetical protein
MSIASEFKSGNFTIYAQWSAILSVLMLIMAAVINFVTLSVINPLTLLASIAAAFFAAITSALEIPILGKCCPGGPRADSVLSFFANILFRAILYVGFAAAMWASMSSLAIIFVAPALALTMTAFCYFVAYIRRQTYTQSSAGANMAARAARSMI